MTDAEYDALKAELDGLVSLWMDRLNLNDWKIVVEYHREGFADGDAQVTEGTAGTCKANWRYEHATVKFNMPVMAECEDREYIVIHELQHVFLNETRNNSDDWLDHEERVVHRLAKAFQNMARIT